MWIFIFIIIIIAILLFLGKRPSEDWSKGKEQGDEIDKDKEFHKLDEELEDYDWIEDIHESNDKD